MLLGNTQKVKNLVYYVQRARTVDVRPGARSCCGVFGVFPTRSALPNKAFSPFTVFSARMGCFHPSQTHQPKRPWIVFSPFHPCNPRSFFMEFFRKEIADVQKAFKTQSARKGHSQRGRSLRAHWARRPHVRALLRILWRMRPPKSLVAAVLGNFRLYQDDIQHFLTS